MWKKLFKESSIPIFFVIALSFMTIGYALYGETLNLNGNVTLNKAGRIEIINAQFVDSESRNLTGHTDPIYEGMHIEFSVSSRSTSFTATYRVTVKNNSLYAYTYTGFPVNAIIDGPEGYVPNVSSTIINEATMQELETGELIDVGEEITVLVTLDFSVDRNQGGITVIVNGTASASEDNTGNLYASVTPTSGDLRGEGTLLPMTMTVVNTFRYARIFDVRSSNENIILVDQTGKEITSFHISANVEEEYTFYLKVKEGSIFLTDETTTNLILSSNMIDDASIDEIKLLVDIDINATDHEKPTVGSVKLQISENNPVEGQAIVSWTRVDTGGSSIVDYGIVVQNETNGTTETYHTGNAITSYTLSNLTPGNYTITVYGVDEAGNSGEEDVADASTANGYASKTSSTNLRWIYNITYNLDRLEATGSSQALIHSSYSATLEVSRWGLSLPNAITVVMNGVTLTSGTDYTYDSSSGEIVIGNVTGDIQITAEAGDPSCLIEGTMVRLADGSYKAIEDIDYDDLLMVYDHENGRISYEYPVWIEKKKKTDSYLKTTFSDGTILKTYGSHGIFSTDLNRYAIVNEISDFHIGTEVVKFDRDGNDYTVKVTDMEIVYEDTYYYHVTSTRYHNILANDFLTTDGTKVTSYMYPFKENMVWGEERDAFLASHDLFTYEQFKDVFPKHLFMGFRMEEAKNVYNHGLLDIPHLAMILGKDNTVPLMRKNGKVVWMVTTSDDVVTEENKTDFLIPMDSYYTLKEPKEKENFVGWLNTSDNKLYQPNDKVGVIYGIHFIAQYKKWFFVK